MVAATVRSGSRPGGCPRPMRWSGSEEIGFSLPAVRNKPISFVNSRAEALGYKARRSPPEMMFPFFGVVVDKNVDPQKVLTTRSPAASGA